MSTGAVRNAILLLLVLSVSACAAKRLRSGQRDIRGTVLTLYEEQILDNLVRLEKGLPIVHLDYGDLYAEVTDTFGAATVSFAYTDVGNEYRATNGLSQPAGEDALSSGSTTSAPEIGASATAATSLKVTAKPVIGDNSVYASYLSYNDDNLTKKLREENHGLRPLERSRCAPQEGAYVLRRQYPDGWWYIPKPYATRFRNFSLAISVLSRKSDSLDPSAFQVHVEAAERISPPVTAAAGLDTVHAYLARLSVSIPADTGTIIAKLPMTAYQPIEIRLGPATRSEILGWKGVTEDKSLLGKKVRDRPEQIESGESVSEVVLSFAHGALPILRYEQDPTTGKTITIRRPPDQLIRELRELPKGVPLRLRRYEKPTVAPIEELLKGVNQRLDQQILQGR